MDGVKTELVKIITRATAEGKNSSWVAFMLAKSEVKFGKEAFVALARHFKHKPEWAMYKWEEYQKEKARIEARKKSFENLDAAAIDQITNVLGGAPGAVPPDGK